MLFSLEAVVFLSPLFLFNIPVDDLTLFDPLSSLIIQLEDILDVVGNIHVLNIVDFKLISEMLLDFTCNTLPRVVTVFAEVFGIDLHSEVRGCEGQLVDKLDIVSKLLSDNLNQDERYNYAESETDTVSDYVTLTLIELDEFLRVHVLEEGAEGVESKRILVLCLVRSVMVNCRCNESNGWNEEENDHCEQQHVDVLHQLKQDWETLTKLSQNKVVIQGIEILISGNLPLTAVAELVTVHIVRISALGGIVGKCRSAILLSNVPVRWNLVQQLFHLLFKLISLVTSALSRNQ